LCSSCSGPADVERNRATGKRNANALLALARSERQQGVRHIRTPLWPVKGQPLKPIALHSTRNPCACGVGSRCRSARKAGDPRGTRPRREAKGRPASAPSLGKSRGQAEDRIPSARRGASPCRCASCARRSSLLPPTSRFSGWTPVQWSITERRQTVVRAPRTHFAPCIAE